MQTNPIRKRPGPRRTESKREQWSTVRIELARVTGGPDGLPTLPCTLENTYLRGKGHPAPAKKLRGDCDMKSGKFQLQDDPRCTVLCGGAHRLGIGKRAFACTGVGGGTRGGITLGSPNQ